MKYNTSHKNIYECKPWPYGEWCNNSAYTPETVVNEYISQQQNFSVWNQAWTQVGVCQ